MSSTVQLTAGDSERSRPLWWMVIAAAAFVAYSLLLLHSDLTRPEPPGFLFSIQDSGTVVRLVAPRSAAARAGLRVGDRLIAANARMLRTRLDWLIVEMNLRSDDQLALDVARGDRTGTVLIPLRRMPLSYWRTAAGAALLITRTVQLATLVLAIVVAFKRPFDRLARLGAWVLASVAVFSIVWPYQLAATWRQLPMPVGLSVWAPLVSSLALPAVFFTFFSAFPRPVIRSQWVRFISWAPMVVIVSLQVQFLAGAIYRPERPHTLNDWTAAEAVVTAGYTIATVAILAVGYRRLTDQTQRRRVRTLAVGSAVGLLSALVVVVGYWWPSDTPLGASIFASPLVAVCLILALSLPVSFAYAILRHRLFDVSFVIRLGLQYALGRRVLVSIIPAAGAIFLADLLIHKEIPFGDIVRARGWYYLGLAGLAVYARLRRNDWLDALDRRFFRERYNAERVLRAIGDDIRQAPSLDAVGQRTVNHIEKALHPEFVALAVRHSPEQMFHIAAVAPEHARLPPWPAESAVVGVLETLRKPVSLPTEPQSWFTRHLPPPEVAALRQHRIELLVPVVRHDGDLSALVLMGPKRSEEPYSAEDEDLLMLVSDSLSYHFSPAPMPPNALSALEECPVCGGCYDFGAARCTKDGAALEITALPRVLGDRYRLDRRIGLGGMGTVYNAFDTALERRVAAKVLRQDVVAADAAERFQSEARVAAALTHPNVVTIHDVGVTASGRAFFIMELLTGLTLREELRTHGRLAAERALNVLRGVAAAVDAAHGRRVIHRDLKPENIFLCRSETEEIPKVLDFGLAKALEVTGGPALTKSGLVAGTPPYMAPEHLAGDEPSPDWDLWAVTVIAFEMITGRLPSRLDANGNARSVEGLPQELHQLFSRALSANPLDRPTSAAEFVADLSRAFAANELPD